MRSARSAKLKKMASGAGFNLEKCTPINYDIGKWVIWNASPSGPLYFDVLADVEAWLVGKGATIKDGRGPGKRKRGKAKKYIWFYSDMLNTINEYAGVEGLNFSESVRNLVGLGIKAWK